MSPHCRASGALLALALVWASPGPARGAFTAYSLDANYSKRDLPTHPAGTPFNLLMRIRVMDILKIDEINSEVSLDVLIQRYWSEPRLRFEAGPAGERRGSGGAGRFPLPQEDHARFWQPDLYVQGMRHFHSMDGLRHLVLRSDNTLEQILRGTLTMRCQFNFRLFPLDNQACKMDFMSPMQSQSELSLGWWSGGRPVEFYSRSPASESPSARSLAAWHVRLQRCEDALAQWHVAGNVSALRVWLLLRRHALSHVLEIYLPTALFVVISWGSFLVRPDMVPGRMVLLVTNLLSLVTIFEASRSTAPPATGLKCLDVWLVACIVFLFLALLEYAAILLRLRGRLCAAPAHAPAAPARALSVRVHSAHPSHPHHQRQVGVLKACQRTRSGLVRKLQSRVRRLALWRRLSSPRDTSWCLLDQLSIFAFPTAFALFNVVYWATYLRASADDLQSTACDR